ncbi:hypothetical protein BAUCODRAFT_517472 [Baudoinia panamericana UAMH 10762]|uniref:Uncharacterized protein n=1 Tax=Baudoinia panamericana (strain UAMH 10762) TaxID=717646 RepID=M2NB65_BAUPA|nr:uncharacterized protein BAUCODRAFT_517472 [Baudoinia panamericana UAMH 10762]EMC96095.1 hypothetical protein BAUCODRAFT_517472 [Baudoinia panamericana UAMH 10762]
MAPKRPTTPERPRSKRIQAAAKQAAKGAQEEAKAVAAEANTKKKRASPGRPKGSTKKVTTGRVTKKASPKKKATPEKKATPKKPAAATTTKKAAGAKKAAPKKHAVDADHADDDEHAAKKKHTLKELFPSSDEVLRMADCLGRMAPMRTFRNPPGSHSHDKPKPDKRPASTQSKCKVSKGSSSTGGLGRSSSKPPVGKQGKHDKHDHHDDHDHHGKAGKQGSSGRSSSKPPASKPGSREHTPAGKEKSHGHSDHHPRHHSHEPEGVVKNVSESLKSGMDMVGNRMGEAMEAASHYVGAGGRARSKSPGKSKH